MAEHPIEDQPILVLLPYEGTFEPGQPPLKVVLRERDYQRLLSYARPAPAVRGPLLILTDATHHITRVGDRDVILSSELAIRVTVAGSATWRVPVSGAREISATVEGRPVPVWVEGGGRLAAIPVEGPGTVRLAIRRTATLARDGSVDSLEFPVNPLPSARLIVGGPPNSGPPTFLNARAPSGAGPTPPSARSLAPPTMSRSSGECRTTRARSRA